LVSHPQVSRLFAATDPLSTFGLHVTWTLFHSISYGFSVWELWGALLSGARLVVVPYWLSREPQGVLTLLREQAVSVLNQTPTAFGQLVQALDTWAGHSQELDVRVVICGGEALEQESVHQWYARSGLPQSRLVNMYGITETTVHVTACELDAHTDWPRQGSP